MCCFVAILLFALVVFVVILLSMYRRLLINTFSSTKQKIKIKTHTDNTTNKFIRLKLYTSGKNNKKYKKTLKYLPLGVLGHTNMSIMLFNLKR